MRSRLDQLAVDAEFLLISVVQGVALAALAAGAVDPLRNMDYQYWPYIFSGLILILFFWSQAINHTISFIGWPLNLTHNLLYFVTAFVEVLAFSQITNPSGWYLANAAFFVVAWFLYVVDLNILKSRVATLPAELYQHALKEQKIGVAVLVPLGLAFNLVAYWQTHHSHNLHLAFGLIQAVVGLVLLIDTVRRFNVRAKLLEQSGV